MSLIASAAAPATYAWGFGEFFGKKEGGQEHRMRPEKMGDRFQMKLPMGEETQQFFDELKTAREAGDEEKVTELREKLKTLHQMEQNAREDELDAALAGGYESWKAFMEAKEMPDEMLEKITAENFPIFVEMHQTRKKLRELEEKLGIQGAGPHHLFIKR